MERMLKLVIIALRLAFVAAVLLGADPIVLDALVSISKVAQIARIVFEAIARIRNVLVAQHDTHR